MSALRIKGLMTMSKGAIPRAVLLADLRRVVRKTGLYTMTAYQTHGRFAYGTFKDRFGTWDHAMKCAGLSAGYRASRVKATARAAANQQHNRRTLEALAEQREVRAGLHRPRTERTCLRCEQPFGSTGPNNRICPTCNLAIGAMGPTMEAFG